ncbi:DUF4926 domain-containing protein [Leptothermofonsia sichuanensis E412]|uniref:DUF4926 domain-containing protein n=1 Tax=Leptothermofonsia sichuanensis TaxID=2917832 RepID=UPI001CA6A5A0|nr:DUF4926 domain-containing protein [Leptothermofonsia sichuanensis]QZZ22048.1 DUF4926 domain-containing protein [Leptothermofonsia sichuanensis E412]
MLIPNAEQAVVDIRKLRDYIYNLWRGQVGTVVETLANGTAFEVEFSDRDGRTYESVGLRPEQIMVLCFEPVPPEMKAKAVAV